MSYTPYYPNGWQVGEAGATPITPAALNNMESGITNAHTEAHAAGHAATNAANAASAAQSTANTAKNTAEAALPKTGGTMTGMLILTEGVHYGTTLPAAGNEGRIFFKKVSR